MELAHRPRGDPPELLLIGDVAWHQGAIRDLHYRPRLVSDFFLGEDRAAVMGQYRTLHGLLASEPALWIVPSHDRELRGRLLAEGVLVDGLAPRAPGRRRGRPPPFRIIVLNP